MIPLDSSTKTIDTSASTNTYIEPVNHLESILKFDLNEQQAYQEERD